LTTPKIKKRIRHEFSTEEPAAIRIGKNGITPDIVKEINRELNRSKTVKIKILKTALQEKTTNEIASNIAEQTKSILIEARGHTFILHREKRIAEI
jgi:RNA-binding protein YhbY